MSQDSIRGVLSRCLVEEDAARTRQLILEVLNTGDPAEAIESMKILLAELTVVALHGPQPSNITLSSRSSSSKKLTTTITTTTTTTASPRLSQEKQKPSLVGTLSLPRPTAEVLSLREKDKNSHSGSDIPSESSGSSEDEGNDDPYAEELWKRTLDGEGKEMKSEALTTKTHKDFFESLIQDIEQSNDYREVPQPTPHPEEKLLLGGHQHEEVQEAVGHVLAQAEYAHLLAIQKQTSSEEDSSEEPFLLTGDVLDQVASEVSEHLLGSSSDQTETLHEALVDALSFLYHQPATAENKALLLKVIEMELHNLLGFNSPAATAESEEAAGDVSSSESVANEADVVSNNNHDDDNTREEDLRRLNEEELDRKELEAGRSTITSASSSLTPAAKSPTTSSSRMHYNDSTSSSSSSCSPPAVSARKSPSTPAAASAVSSSPAAAAAATTSTPSHVTPAVSRSASSSAREKKTPLSSKVKNQPVAATPMALDADATEGVPAWLLPKSPLDPVFRKGYGGLGQSNLQEVIDLLTPHRKNHRGYDSDGSGDEEEDDQLPEGGMAGHESDDSSQNQVELDTNDAQGMDEDGVEEECESGGEESSGDSMRNHMNTYSMDYNYDYDGGYRQRVAAAGINSTTSKQVADEFRFIGIEDLPEPETNASKLGSTTEQLHSPLSGGSDFADRIRRRLQQYSVETHVVENRPHHGNTDASASSLDLSNSSLPKKDKVRSNERPQSASKSKHRESSKKSVTKGVHSADKGHKKSHPRGQHSHHSNTETILMSNLALDENPLPEHHPVHRKGVEKVAFTKNPKLNAMIHSSFESHIAKYGGGSKGGSAERTEKPKAKSVPAKGSSPAKGSDQVLFDESSERVYHFDEVETTVPPGLEEEDDDNASMDTEEHNAYVSSHSNSPQKASSLSPQKPESRISSGDKLTESSDEKKVTGKKGPKRRKSSSHSQPKNEAGKSSSSDNNNNNNKQPPSSPKPIKTKSGPTKANTKSPSRPNSAGRLRSSSESRLLEPTEASKMRARANVSK
eukprot:gene1277-1395_t